MDWKTVTNVALESSAAAQKQTVIGKGDSASSGAPLCIRYKFNHLAHRLGYIVPD